MAQDKDAIGFDPVKWVQRLRDVNDGSQFKPDSKYIIDQRLSDLQRELERGGHGMPS